MGVALLPIERIPIFVWGILLMGIGGFLAWQEVLFSWDQAKMSLVFFAGASAFVYDVKKRISAGRQQQAVSKHEWEK